MGRRPLPARLWLRDDTEPHEWLILDNVAGKRVQQGTGCGPGDRGGAEGKLAAYVAGKAALAANAEALKPKTVERRPFLEVPVAEAIQHGLENIAPRVKRPGEYIQRATKLLDIVEDDLLGHVDAKWCKRVWAEFGSLSSARRAMEDLRAGVNDMIADGKVLGAPRFTLPDKGDPRPDYLHPQEVVALVLTAHRERDTQMREFGPKGSGDYRLVTTSRRRWKHLVPFILIGTLTCSRASRIYEASFERLPGRPWVDLEHGIYTRLAQGEVESDKKRAPEVPLPDRLVRVLRRWFSDPDPGLRRSLRFGRDFLVEYAGRPVDCRKAFQACVVRAMEQYPDLFKRRDGTPKEVVRHTLRHTGVTLLSQMGVPPDQICSYAGMEREVYDRVYRHNDPEYMAALMAALGGRTSKRTLNGVIPKRKKVEPLPPEEAPTEAVPEVEPHPGKPKAKCGRKKENA